MSEVESGFGETASQFKSTHDFASCSTFPQVLDDTKESTMDASLTPSVSNPRYPKRSYTDSGTVTNTDKDSKKSMLYLLVIILDYCEKEKIV